MPQDTCFGARQVILRQFRDLFEEARTLCVIEELCRQPLRTRTQPGQYVLRDVIIRTAFGLKRCPRQVLSPRIASAHAPGRNYDSWPEREIAESHTIPRAARTDCT